jgi:hypothetical protein
MFEPTVIGFYPVVGVAFRVVPGCRDQLVEHSRVGRCGVGNDLDRYDLQHRQRTAEEPAGSLLVATRRDEHVDDLAVLVHRAVHVAAKIAVVPPNT